MVRQWVVAELACAALVSGVSAHFPYFMTERKCEGTVTMTITLPATSGAATGTMEAEGCGRDPGSTLPGTVELVPAAKPK